MKKLFTLFAFVLLASLAAHAQTSTKTMRMKQLGGTDVATYQKKLQSRGMNLVLKADGDMLTITGNEKEVEAFVNGLSQRGVTTPAVAPAVDYKHYIISKNFDTQTFGAANIQATAKKHGLKTEATETGIMVTGDVEKMQTVTQELLTTLNK
jgi:hypothetical protein